MRAALFSSTIDIRNGYGNITYELAKHLHTKGIEITLCLPEGEKKHAQSTSVPFDIRYTLPPYIFRLHQPKSLGYWRRIDLSGFDIAHSLFAFPYCVMAARSTRKSRIPFLMGAQGTYGVLPLTYFPEKYLLRWAYKAAQRIVVPSTFTQRMIQQYAGQTYPIQVIHNGVDFSRFVSKPDTSALQKQYAGKKIALTVGGLKERKGQDMVLRALAIAKEKCPNLCYIMVGEGSLQHYLQTMAQELGVADRIVFAGNKTGEELVQYYHLCDMYVHTSRIADLQFEGFGIVYLEASACGKPLIATDAGGIRDAVLHDTTGIVVPDGDIMAIARAMIDLYHDEPRCQRLGEQGRAYARKHDWDLIAEQYASLYRTVCA